MNQIGASLEAYTMKAAPWVERLARAGYFAKGIVYTLIGVLGIQAARGASSDEEADSTGALRTIAEEPFGQILLALLAVGLIGYVLWRMVQAATDPERHEDESAAKKIGRRVFYAISGLIYAAVAWRAIQLLAGSPQQSSGPGQRADSLLSAPAGQILLGLAGLAVLAYGGHQLWKALKQKFDKRFALEELSPGWRSWVIRLARIGVASRGVVFLLIGFYVAVAAFENNPAAAIGVNGALARIEEMAGGSWLAIAVAVGLMAYGIYTFLKGRYRRISTT